ncbi:hypothetical protein [Dactylosporangium sp. NPDC005555]|uniref:hypothetical protein n=1 Tax=Dactylosporangium sp. NPDC005555 TaxID=3154889 RepID=UPI0033B6F54D
MFDPFLDDALTRIEEMEALQAAAARFNRRAATLCPDLESQRAVQRLGMGASARYDDLAVLHPLAGTARAAQGGASVWAQLVVQECEACAMYHTFLEQETDQRLRQLWEVHLRMELADLRTAADLLRHHEDRDPQEIIADPQASAADVSGDLPDLLAGQQARIEQQFQLTLAAVGEDRHTAFGDLAWMIAVHETTEEELAHPLTRHLAGPAEHHLADHLLDEERRISEALADVSISLGEVDGLAAVHDLLSTHTRREHREEFPALRSGIAAGELRDLGDLVRATEAQAFVGATARPGMAQASELVRDALRPA